MAVSRATNRQSGASNKTKKSNSKKKNSQENVSIGSSNLEPWAPSTRSALKALLSARLCASMWNNISDCDETYNYWEPTHYFLYGSGFQTWEYSPVYAIRSYAYILLHVLPGWIYSNLLQANKVLVFYFIRCLLGFICAFCEVYFYKGVCHRFGPHVGRLMLIFLLFSAGMFISSAAYLPSSFTMYFTLLAMGAWFLQKNSIAIICVAISSFLGWPFTALLGVPIALDLVIIQKKFSFFLKWCVFAAVVLLIPIIQIDSFYYGKFVCAPLNIVLYNIFSSHGPNIYGVESWTFYFINGFLNFNFVFLAALLALPLTVIDMLFKLPKEKNWSSLLSLLSFYLWIIIFFTQPHKEERFLFPIYPLICLCGAISVDLIQKAWYYVFVKKKIHTYIDSTAFIAISIPVISSIISLSRILILYRGYHAPFETYLTLGQLASEEQQPASITNVCVGKEWYRFPSSFFLPDGWQLQFIKSEFRGQLPKPYSKSKNATLIIPQFMNDKNLEESSRYVDLKSCHYLVDLDLPEESKWEPRYSLMEKDWLLVSNIPFLHSKRSHRMLRAFYIPFFTDVYCEYASYNLLKSRNQQRITVQKGSRIYKKINV